MRKKTRRGKGRRLTPLPKGHRVDVRRDEFNRLIDMLNARGEIVNQLIRTQEIQFERIAQIQAELDLIKRAWLR
jgi:hypothetical protein